MDFGFFNDDVFFVWELINYVMFCMIIFIEKKLLICLYVLKKINKNFVNLNKIGLKRDKWNV